MQLHRDQAARRLAARIAPGRKREAGTVLAFDFGEKRIGVAVGNTELRLAHPLAPISYRSRDECYTGIAQRIQEWQPIMLVVGLPVHADGTEHEMTRKCRRFARRLEGRFGIETMLMDERHTSIDAGIALRNAGVGEKRQKHLVDSVAAQLILQDYFDKRDAVT